MIWELYFKKIEIETILWVYDYEKVRRKFFVDLTVKLDISKSYLSDDLDDTIDSGLIKSVVIDHVVDKNYNLLECICYEIADAVKSIDPRILSVKASVGKYWCIDKVECVSFTCEV